MKQLIISIILSLLNSNAVSAQSNEPSQFESCRNLHENGMLSEAIDCYQKFSKSIFTLYKSALIAKELNNNKIFKKTSNQLIKGKYSTALSTTYYSKLFEDNPKKQLKIIDKGLKKYPSDNDLLTSKLNYLIKHNDIDGASVLIEQLIDQKKGNIAVLYYTKGHLHQTLNNIDKALTAYHKAIILDTNYFDAYFNIGSIYFNEAADLYEIANLEADNEEYKKKTEKGDKEIKKSIYYLTRAHELKPEDLIVLKSLKTTYLQLGMKKEFDEYKSKIKAIEK